MDVALIICAVVAIVIIVAVIYIKVKIQNFLQNASRMAFGTDSIKDGLDNQAEMLSKRPKSVSSMTSIYLPQITSDFPQFNWEEFRHKGENMLKSALIAISTQNINAIIGGSTDLNHMVELIINEHKNQGIIINYDAVKIHCTEITQYRKIKGNCIITMQSAIEYYQYTTKNGRDIKGSRTRLTQTKYNIDLVYVQDEEQANKYNADKTVEGLKCPNCGANITNLGLKKCEYCGSNAHEINIHVWQFNKFCELPSNIVV